MATRTEIENYLCVRDSVNIIVNRILNETVPIESISRSDEKYIIELTIINVERKNAYLKDKSLYEAAVNHFKTKENFNSQTIFKVANKYKINGPSLAKEVHKFFEANYYVFDKIIEGEYISYVQEETLWQFLKQLINLNQIFCTCRICFLLESSRQVFKFAKEWNIYWYQSARIEWVASFEMRYRTEIYLLCSKQCVLSGVNYNE